MFNLLSTSVNLEVGMTVETEIGAVHILRLAQIDDNGTIVCKGRTEDWQIVFIESKAA
jgi:hypothetical protein